MMTKSNTIYKYSLGLMGAVSLFALAACGSMGMGNKGNTEAFDKASATRNDPVKVGGANMYPSKNIVENLSKSADHTNLVAAVTAAGLTQTLTGPGPFTVFAPTNQAFTALPAGALEGLLQPANQAALARVLTCHVLAGQISATELAAQVQQAGGTLQLSTVGGCILTVSGGPSGLMITDENGSTAKITTADVVQSNGIIHVVDAVILPKSGM
jgi:uncharacterized surface protein with fasciclin (FAS1) repeats